MTEMLNRRFDIDFKKILSFNRNWKFDANCIMQSRMMMTDIPIMDTIGNEKMVCKFILRIFDFCF